MQREGSIDVPTSRIRTLGASAFGCGKGLLKAAQNHQVVRAVAMGVGILVVQAKGRIYRIQRLACPPQLLQTERAVEMDVGTLGIQAKRLVDCRESSSPVATVRCLS